MTKKGFAPIIIVLIIALLAAGSITGYLFIKNKQPKLIGGETDSHSCLIAAGYSWCEAKQKCLRTWEEPCEETTTTSTITTTTTIPPTTTTTSTTTTTTTIPPTTTTTPTSPPALIGDFVWDDKNADGIQAADEPGIPGVLVVLYDALGNFVNSTMTNGAGLYTFTVQPGTYSEVFVSSKGYVFSPQDQGSNNAIDSDANPSSGRTALFTMAANQVDLTWDAGLYRIPTEQSAGIGDFVWCDKNYNGLQDNEPGIPYVWVFLYGNVGNLVGSTITDLGGNYYFTVQPGTYSLCFAPPPFTKQDVPPNDAIDSDADPSSGCTSWFTVIANQIDLTWDAGTWKF
jgi:hypothetical protein